MCLPNNVRPLAPTWAVMWAGPVSLATTNELPLIKEVNWDISSALPLSNKAIEVSDLNNLSAEKVFERLSNSLS